MKQKKKLNNLPIYALGISIALVLALTYFLVVSKDVTDHTTIEGVSVDRSIAGLALVQESEGFSGERLTLTAGIVKKSINGKEIRMYAYNGQIPGPLLTVTQGDTLSVDFVNNLDVATSVHWHGLRLDNQYDGVVGVTQDAVQLGEQFAYELKFPDPGLYWYHPHVREEYQQELGLYGMILVTPENGDAFNEVSREEVLVIDDILLTNGDVVSFHPDYTTLAMMGRFGNVMLVNGETEYKLAVARGEIVRFYIANVANTRTFNISIPGAKIKVVGSDGGLFEREFFADSIILAPSERYIVEAIFENPGEYSLMHVNPFYTYSLGTITVLDEQVTQEVSFTELREHTLTQSEIASYRSYFDEAPEITMRLAMDTVGEHGQMMMGTMMHGSGEEIEWEDSMPMMNAHMTSDFTSWEIIDEKTGKKNMDIDSYEWEVGDVVKIRIFNDPDSMHPMQHPIHFHGNRFLVVARDGATNDNMVWKDTVLVKTGETVDILLEISNPGEWMAHCHIAEHLSSGMMMVYEVTQA